MNRDDAKRQNEWVSAVFGTHTHVQTADEQILEKGTGYITDVGMTGTISSVLGVKSEGALTLVFLEKCQKVVDFLLREVFLLGKK